MAKTSRSKKASDVQRRFHDAADSLEPRFKANWNRQVAIWTNDPEMLKAMRSFASGRTTAYDFINTAGLVIDKMPQSLVDGMRVMVAKGYNLQAELAGMDKIKRAGEWADRYAGVRVQDITMATRDAIGTYVTQSIENGVPVNVLAKQIEKVIGNDPRYARAAANYRNGLHAIEAKPGKADVMTEKYLDRAARMRSRTIARTETISALAHGQLEAIRTAMADGLLAPDTKLVWITTPGCCDKCSAIDGDEQPATAPLWDGRYDAPPAHPNCRCSIGVA